MIPKFEKYLKEGGAYMIHYLKVTPDDYKYKTSHYKYKVNFQNKSMIKVMEHGIYEYDFSFLSSSKIQAIKQEALISSWYVYLIEFLAFLLMCINIIL